MLDVPGTVALIAVAALTTSLAMRARRAGTRTVKWMGLVPSTLFALVFILTIIAGLTGFYRLSFPPGRPAVSDIGIAHTPAQIARGAKFAAICAQCHSPNGKAPLTGLSFSEGAGPSLGTLYGANLTPAGEIKDWSDGYVIRAIREGVHKSGRPLVIMPSEVFHNLSDADVESIVAYLRSQPSTGPETPPTKLSVLAAAAVGLGVAATSEQPRITHPVIAPPEGTGADYGRYLVSILGCRTCHGENLEGRKISASASSAGPNLTLIIPKWSPEDFTRTFRTGVDPYNHTLRKEMPWRVFSAFATDDDLTALYAYLHGMMPVKGPLK